jgi:O-antigen ligase
MTPALLAMYAVVTLYAGTVAGLSQPYGDPLLTALAAGVLVWRALSPRPGTAAPCAACWVWLANAIGLALLSVCPERSLHLVALFAAAAAFFSLASGANRDSFMRGLALLAAAAAIFGLGSWLLGYSTRVAAPFGQHHYAAGFLLLHLPLTAALARRQPLWWIAAALQAAAVLGTRSVAGVTVLALLAMWGLRRKPGWLGALALAVILVAVFAPRTRSLLVRGEDPSLSVENRVRYLRTGAAMVAARPWGWGLGTVPFVAAPFRPQIADVMPQGEVLPHLHNTPLHLAVETGLIGLAAAVWLAWKLRSLPVVIYAIFALADYQLDLPALLFAVGAVSGAGLQPVPAAFGKPARVALLALAAIIPLNSMCGWDQFKSGDYLAAAARLPDMIPVSSTAGAALAESGRYRDALPHLERAARLDPFFTLAHFHLGRARLARDDRRGAEEAFAAALLAQPVTVFADGWDRPVYVAAVRRALQQLDAYHPPDDRSRHRKRELQDFLAANAASPPHGIYPRVFSEITDADLAHNTSLLVFRKVGPPQHTSGITVRLPEPGFYIPPGAGYLRGFGLEALR